MMSADTSKLNAAIDAHAAAQRGAEEAAPAERADAEALLQTATVMLDEARRETQERENSFGGEAAPGSAQPTSSGASVRERTAFGRGGALGREQITITYTDPEFVEACAANARAEAFSAEVRQGQAERAEAARQEAIERERTMNEAARLYEGLPQHRGIDREGYIQMETEWRTTLEADSLRHDAAVSEAREAYAVDRARTTGVPHREAVANEHIEGKIVGARRFEGAAHLVIEQKGPGGLERIIVRGDIPRAALFREVAVDVDDRGRVQPQEIDRTPER